MDIQQEIVNQRFRIEYLNNILLIRKLKNEVGENEDIEEPSFEDFIRWEQDKFIKEKDEIDGEEIVEDDVYNKIEVLDTPEKRLEALREAIRIQNVNDCMLKERMEEPYYKGLAEIDRNEPYSPKEPFRWVNVTKRRNKRAIGGKNANLRHSRRHSRRHNHRRGSR